MVSSPEKIEYMREWRRRNHDKHIAGVKKAVARKVEKYNALLEGRTCERCGFGDARALEFHHRDPKQKRFTISYGARRRTWEAVLEEVAKCEVVCANCHRIEHIGGVGY